MIVLKITESLNMPSFKTKYFLVISVSGTEVTYFHAQWHKHEMTTCNKGLIWPPLKKKTEIKKATFHQFLPIGLLK